MIARIWHGVTASSDADEYLAYLNKTGLTDYRAIEGNRGAYVLRRIEGKRAHFLLVSLWDSLDAIRKYAGDEVNRAKYYPEDDAYLIELEPNVQHYDVVATP